MHYLLNFISLLKKENPTFREWQLIALGSKMLGMPEAAVSGI